jgi:hypothetical protein
MNSQNTKKYSYNWKNTDSGRVLFRRQVEKNGDGWKYVGGWVQSSLKESAETTTCISGRMTDKQNAPRKKKIPPPTGRDEKGRLLMPSSNEELTLKYENICYHVQNISNAIEGLTDSFSKLLLEKYREKIIEEKKKMFQLYITSIKLNFQLDSNLIHINYVSRKN